MNRHGTSLRWNKARVVFECAPIIAPSAVSRRTMTLMVYGDSEFAAMRALRTQLPRHCDFTILDLHWAQGGHRDNDS